MSGQHQSNDRDEQPVWINEGNGEHVLVTNTAEEYIATDTVVNVGDWA